MSNLFDYNSRANDALVGGGTSESAFGFGHPKPGLNLGRPDPSLDPALVRARERTKAAQAQVNAPRPRGEPVLGYNPTTGDVFSGGKVFKSDYDGIKQAAATGLLQMDNQQLPEGFQPVYASEMTAKIQRDVQRSTGIFEGANDVMIDVANAAAGGVKSAIDFVDPNGNVVSDYLGRKMEEGLRSQSDPVKYQKDLLAQGLSSSDLATQAGAVGRYIYENPLQSLGQAVGSFAGPGLAAKGARALGGVRAGVAASAATSGAMGGGDAAQSAYQQVMNSPGLQHLPPEQRERMALDAARKASVLPFVVGAAGGAIGAEGALARGMASQTGKGVLRTSMVEGGSEFIEEGTTALSGNVAASQYAPDIDVGAGVFGQALMGGVLGAGIGAGVGALQPRAPRVDPTTGKGDLLNPAPAQPAKYTPPSAYQIAGQQWQDQQKSPGLYGYSDVGTRETFPGLLAEGYTQNALDALNGTPTQAENLAQQRATTQSLGAQKLASEVGQQWQDLQAQQEQTRADQMWPAAVAGQEWQSLLNQRPVTKAEFTDAMDPDFMSGIDPYAQAPAASSEITPTGKQFVAPFDRRMLPTATIPTVPPAGDSAPAVAAPVSPAPATGQGLSTPSETLPAAPVAPAAKRGMVRRPDLGADGTRALAGALDNDPEADTSALGDTVQGIMDRIHTLTRARDRALAQFASARMYKAGKNGILRRTTKDKVKQTVYTSPKDDVVEVVEGTYTEWYKNLQKTTQELHAAFAALEAEVGTNNIQKAQKLSKAEAEGGKQVSAAALFSREFRDYMDQAVTAERPMGGRYDKDIRERRELGAFAGTKLSDLYHTGWRLNTAKNKTTGEYVVKKPWTGVQAILMKIRYHTGNPFLANLAGRLDAMQRDAEKDGAPPLQMVFYTADGRVVDKGTTVEIASGEKYPGAAGTVAFYDPKTHTIHLSAQGQKPGIVLHEIIHATLAGWVQKNPNSPHVKALETLRKHVVAQLKKNPRGVPADVVAALSADGSGIQEFLTYGLTDQSLQEAMRDIKASADAGLKAYLKDTWNGFVAIVRRIMGLEANYTKVLDQYMHVTGNLFDNAYYEQYSGGGLDAKVMTGYDKVAGFWKRVAGTTASNLFQTAKMDDSYGKPKQAYTMDEILAHHLKGDWKVTPNFAEGAPNPDGTRVAKGWKIVNRNKDEGGEFGIFENDKGEVTVQSPDSIPGKSQGSKVLQAALAYAFYNNKVFVNELEGMGMSDSAVTRYAEAMASAAIKYGSTDFMRPNARQMDPSQRDSQSQGSDAFTDNAQAYQWGLQGWKTSDAKGTMEGRFINNLNLLSKMLSSMAFAGNTSLESYSFYPDEGFRTEKGEPATNLTATQKRAIMVNHVAGISQASANRQADELAGMDDAGREKAGLKGVLYATGLPTNKPQPGLDLEGYAADEPYLAPIVRAVLPMLYGNDPKLARTAGEWAGNMARKLREKAPELAAFLQLFNADFNVSPAIATLVDKFKSMRNAPTTFANQFGEWILRSGNKDEIIDAFRYMDELDADPKAADPKKLPPHVVQKVKDALEALDMARSGIAPDSELGKLFADLKPSEMLTHALRADAIGSSTFGARDEKVLKGREFRVALIDVDAPNVGGVMRTGKFYPVYKPGTRDIEKMVHASKIGTYKVDKSRPFRFDTDDKKTGEWKFRELTTAEGLFNDPELKGDAAETVATSFLNTVSIMANAVATRHLTAEINRVGTAEKKVFEDDTALAKHLGKARVKVFDLGMDEAKNEKIAFENRKPGNWVRVPSSAAYGELSGKIVEGPIWARISDSLNRSMVVKSQAFNTGMRVFKAAKTRYSPSTIATNVMGNFTLAHLNNVSLAALKDGLRLYIKYQYRPQELTKPELQIMSAFHRSGATLGDWSTNEVKQKMYEALASETEMSGTSGLGTLMGLFKYHGKLVEMATKAGRKGKAVDDWLSSAYATTDNMFRLAAFMTKYGELQKANPGWSQAELTEAAGQHAKEVFLDYDNDARFVNVARQTMLPFVSFTYAYAGRVLKVAKNEPWKLGTLALGYSIVMAALNAAGGTGDEEEDKRQRARDKMEDTTWFGAYKQARIGTTEDGRALYFDLAKWFMPTPIDFKDNPNGFMGIDWFPATLTPNNPWLTFAMYAFGFDPYTGQKFRKDTMSTMEGVTETAKKTAGIFSPPWANKLTGPKPGVLGEVESPYTFYARTMLLPIKSNSIEESKKILQIEIGRTNDAYDREISAMRRAQRIGKIDREEMEKAIEELRKRRKEKLDELKKGL